MDMLIDALLTTAFCFEQLQTLPCRCRVDNWEGCGLQKDRQTCWTGKAIRLNVATSYQFWRQGLMVLLF